VTNSLREQPGLRMSDFKSFVVNRIRRIKRQFGYDIVSVRSLRKLIEQETSLRQALDQSIQEREFVARELEALRRNFLDDVLGHKMYVNPFDRGISLQMLVGKTLEGFRYKGEIGFILRHIKPGQKVVDVGANIGFFTLLCARQAGPTGRVWAFEPGPQSFALLSTNVSINGYNNVVVENSAVAASSGRIDLFVCRDGESDNRIAGTLLDFEQRDRVNVRCIALDDYFAKVDTPINFIKIDVQGAETLVLRGMENMLRRQRPIISFEYTPYSAKIDQQCDQAELLGRLRGFGYCIYELPEIGVERRVSDACILESMGNGLRPAQTTLVLMPQEPD
jgi:FkbM family methyltransferase